MIFNHSVKSKLCLNEIRSFVVNKAPIEVVKSFKYLGYMISDSLDNTEDINRAKSKFYAEFNVILRNFHFTSKEIKTFLFKQYCLQLYGSELWFGSKKSRLALKEFALGYHKAVKKLLGLSMHESNHYACQEANLLTFQHFVNKLKIGTLYCFFV